MIARLERIFIFLNQALIVTMMMAMATLVFINVITRYIFGFSLNWSEEVSRFLMIWITYLGAGLAMRESRHVAIEYFQDLLPQRSKPYARAFVGIIILIFLAFLTVLGFQFASFAWRQRTPVLGISQGFVYLTIPLGAIMFAIHLLLISRDYVRHSAADEILEQLAKDQKQGPELQKEEVQA